MPLAIGVIQISASGITNLTRELGGKRLELVKEAVPKIARIAVLYDPAIPSSVIEVKEDLPLTARPLNVTVQPWEIRAADVSIGFLLRLASSALMEFTCMAVGL